MKKNYETKINTNYVFALKAKERDDTKSECETWTKAEEAD